MAEDFRQRNDRNDNQKHRGNRNDIIREDKSLLWLVPNLRTRRASGRSWLGWFEIGDLQSCCRDRRNSGKRYGQRRNGLPGSGSCGDGIETRSYFGNSPAAPGVAAERVTRKVEKRLRKGIGDDRIGLASGLECGDVLRERFDRSHADRPDVCGRSERGSRGLRSVANIESARGF